MESNGTEIDIQPKIIQQEWVMVPEAKESFTTDWEKLRGYDYGTLVRSLARDYDNGFVPSLEQAKGLICFMFDENTYYEGMPDNIPWPEGFNEIPNSEGINDGVIAKKTRTGDYIVAESKKAGMLTESYYSDSNCGGLKDLLGDVFDHLDDKSIALLSKFVVENIAPFSDHLEDAFYDIWNLQMLTLEKVRWDSEYAVEVGDAVVNLLEEYAENDNANYWDAGPEWAFVFGMGAGDTPEHVGMRKMVYRSLAFNSDISVEKKAKVLRMTLENFGLAREFNTLREMMNCESLSVTERKNVEEMLRQMLSLPEGYEVHKSLKECYEAMEFDKYPVSEYTRPIRIKLLEKLIFEKGIGKDDQVLDVATGAGWLVDTMKNELGMRNVWGVDVDMGLFNKAKESVGDYFSASSWDKLPFASDHFSLLTCLGRSLPHSEEERNFRNALHEMIRVVKNNGTFVFDMPDSSVGNYKLGLERNRETMMKMGCSRKFADDTYVIVDGPKGEKGHFYNRYVPSREMIEDELRRKNIEFEVIEEYIPNEKGEPSGDKNLVFVCRKTYSDREKEEKKKAEDLADKLLREKFKLDHPGW